MPYNSEIFPAYEQSTNRPSRSFVFYTDSCMWAYSAYKTVYVLDGRCSTEYFPSTQCCFPKLAPILTVPRYFVHTCFSVFHNVTYPVLLLSLRINSFSHLSQYYFLGTIIVPTLQCLQVLSENILYLNRVPNIVFGVI